MFQICPAIMKCAHIAQEISLGGLGCLYFRVMPSQLLSAMQDVIFLFFYINRSELCELYKPVEDRLISSCMEILDLEKESDGRTSASLVRNVWAKVFPKPRRCWLPTGCLVIMPKLIDKVCFSFYLSPAQFAHVYHLSVIFRNFWRFYMELCRRCL